MKKQNRRSQVNKRNRHSQAAQQLLDSFHWEKDEQVLLELAATGEFSVEEIREFRWNQFRLGFQCVILREKELNLSEQCFQWLEQCLTQEIDLYGNPWSAPEDKLFSHSMAKVVHKEILSFKE